MSRRSSHHVRSTFAVQLTGATGSLLVSRPGPAVVSLLAGGRGVEDLCPALTQELEPDFVIQGALSLFVDARSSVALEMLKSASWARWFREHRRHIARVVLLVPSGNAQPTSDLAHGAAGLEDRLEVLRDLNAFERAQSLAMRSVGTAPGTPTTSGTWDRVDLGGTSNDV